MLKDLTSVPRSQRVFVIGVSLAMIAALVAFGIVSARAGGHGGPSPFFIDGDVPDGGSNPGSPPLQFGDPCGALAELGPENANLTKLGAIHTAPKPMLDFTNPNGQTDLCNVWLDTAKDAAGDAWLYFAWERDSNKGSGVVTFEFHQGALAAACDYTGIDQVLPETAAETALIANCNPWEGRAEGDFMIVWDQQGQNIDIILRTFTGGAFDAGVELIAGGDAEAERSSDKYFGEAAVNLSDTVFAGVQECVTIANIIPGTITGNSDSADYKDTLFANFANAITISNCGSIKVTKVDDEGVAMNGITFSVYLDDGDLTAELGGDDVFVDSCTTTGVGVNAGMCTIVDVFEGDYWVDETAGLDSALYDVDSDLPELVTVTADSQTTVTATNDRKTGRIVILKLDEDGDPLGGAAFAIDPSPGTPPDDGSDLVNIPGTGSTGLFCIDGLEFFETGGASSMFYTVTETTAPFGYDPVSDFMVEVTEAGVCQGVTGADDDVVEINNSPTPGTIDVLKEDDDGNPLEGVGISIYTSDGDAFFEPTDDDVQFDSEQDTAADGTTSFTSLPLGEYWVAVSDEPAGYTAPAAQKVTIALADGGDVEFVTLTDVETHKVIVVVCHEGTSTLAASDYGVLTSVASSDVTASQETFLCGLTGISGQSHGNLPITVDVGSDAHTP